MSAPWQSGFGTGSPHCLVREHEEGTAIPSIRPLEYLLMSMDFYYDIAENKYSRNQLTQKEGTMRRVIARELDIIQRALRAYSDLLQKCITKLSRETNKSEDHLRKITELEKRLEDTPDLYELDKLKTTYSSELHYWHRMLPIYLVELKDTIHMVRTTEMGVIHSPIRAYITTLSHKKYHSVDASQKITIMLPDLSCYRYVPGDLVLLYLRDDGSEPDLAGPIPSPNNADDPRPYHLLGIVDDVERNLVTIQVHFDGRVAQSNEPDEDKADDGRTIRPVSCREVVDRFRCIIPQYAQLHGHPQIQSLYLCKVMSMTVAAREFQACLSLPLLRLRDHIVTPRLPSRKTSTPKLSVSSELRDYLRSAFNQSQMTALQACLKPEGITLIQGPPGTGKTATIMGILSLILASGPSKNTSPSVDKLDSASPPSDNGDRCVSLSSSPWLNTSFQPWQDQCSWDIDICEDGAAYSDGHRVTPEEVVRSGSEKITNQNKVLVCAASNAAVDEILKRLVRPISEGGGLRDSLGRAYHPTVVRVGPNLHADVAKYSLEERVNSRIQTRSTMYADRAALRQEILSEMNVVCATLSMAGCRDLLTFSDGFETVVIDEASQAIELSTLIPMKLNCKRMILVGDPKQLSATVFSNLAASLSYDWSYFSRLESSKAVPVHLLSTQYRMHPKISNFSSRKFYQNKLKDAQDIISICRPPSLNTSCDKPDDHSCWYDCLGPLTSPLVFLSVTGDEEVKDCSLVNRKEADVVVEMLQLLKLLLLNSGDEDWMSRIAIITPYSAQVTALRRRILSEFSLVRDAKGKCPIDVNTVDGFQGREKDFVLFSTVRSQVDEDDAPIEGGSIGFLEDERRMNVAITRARLNLMIIGNREYLSTARSSNQVWGQFIDHCSKYGVIIDLQSSLSDYLAKRWLRHPLEKQRWMGLQTQPTIQEEAGNQE